MKTLYRTSLLALLALALFAETGSRFPTCGDQNGAPCHCLRRTIRLQDQAMADCRKNGGTPETCLVMQPDHCDVVDRFMNEEEYAAGESAMPDRCTMFCKRGDCSCGADKSMAGTCHILHKAADHAVKKGKK